MIIHNSNAPFVWYSVPWDLVKDTKPERYKCRVRGGIGPEYLREVTAQICAEDFFDNHDGWEASWPISLILYEGEDGQEVARYSVDLESRPHFIANNLGGKTE